MHTGVKVAWMALPALFFLISAIAMKAYPLAGEKWMKMKEELRKKHEKEQA